MTSYKWVIDTWVLATASNFSDPSSKSAHDFLVAVEDSHHIALDDSPDQSAIVTEYRRFIWPRVQTIVSQWWQRMLSGGRIVVCSGDLLQHNQSHLLDTLNFHNDDIKFVAVAYHSPDHLLVSEDSDYYKPGVEDYLTNELGISLFRVVDALEKARMD